ncbi:MAG: hypothetical protein ACD_83C00113G0003 [uncultured bacterium]|nr:MAG: hypothetical protein ACD_83C00113G0003 [uncultured bacterium]
MTQIIIDPKICHGKPCIKGTRIMVETILDLVGQGLSFDQIIADYYPELTKSQLKSALEYSASILTNETVLPLLSLKSI